MVLFGPSFVLLLLVFWMQVEEKDCFIIILSCNPLVVARQQQQQSSRFCFYNSIQCYKKHNPLLPRNNKRNHLLFLGSTNVDDNNSASTSVISLKDKIIYEFKTGSRGLNGADGRRFFYPGLVAVLTYPPHAQEAWMSGVMSARQDYRNRHLQNDDNNEIINHNDKSRRKSIVITNTKVTTFQRFKSRFFSSHTTGKNKVTLRQQLAKMSLSVAISYGFVSNLAACSSIVLTWYIFTKKAPGQWKPFLAVYAGFYLFHNIIRPARFALSMALGPKIDNLLKWVQKRWKVENKGLAILIVMFTLNICLCTGSMFVGILLSSHLNGVPIFPVVVGK